MYYRRSYGYFPPERVRILARTSIVEVIIYYPSGNEYIIGIRGEVAALTKWGANRKANKALGRMSKKSSDIKILVPMYIAVSAMIVAPSVAIIIAMLKFV